MNPLDNHPIDFFNEWFADPISAHASSVAGIINALNRHPIADDQTAQDYVMPVRRCRERAGRFRIYGENQDTYYCFVYDGDESKANPPVYFESCLDLSIDYGIEDSEIINNDHILVAERFTDFLWHILGHHICLRMESSGQFTHGVSGIVCDRPIELDDSFTNPLGNEFPAGFTCYVSNGVVCAPDWGAAFLNAQSRDSFMARYLPHVSRQWAQQ